MFEKLKKRFIKPSKDKKRADTLNAAIQYACDFEDGLDWLRCWNAGDPEEMAELEAYIKKL